MNSIVREDIWTEQSSGQLAEFSGPLQNPSPHRIGTFVDAELD